MDKETSFVFKVNSEIGLKPYAIFLTKQDRAKKPSRIERALSKTLKIAKK